MKARPVDLFGKTFELMLDEKAIQSRVTTLAQQINAELKDQHPFFVVVLNGAFVFAADLLRQIDVECNIGFIKVSSYVGTESTGQMKEELVLKDSVKGRNLVLVEDIVDSGHTIDHLIQTFTRQGARSVKVACALLKPGAYRKEHPIHFAGFEIGNEFVVGYGLDYDGIGRNLKEIYKLATK